MGATPVKILLAAAFLAVITAGGGWAAPSSGPIVSSPAFAESGAIPERYTCSGQDASPPLNWKGIPSSAKALVLVVEDPEAPSGTFTHWIVYNIEARSSGVAENALKVARPAVNYPQGVNDFGHVGYNGPCPPPGTPHHYHFKLYALSTALQLPDDVTAKELDAAMRGHVLAVGELIGTFAR